MLLRSQCIRALPLTGIYTHSLAVAPSLLLRTCCHSLAVTLSRSLTRSLIHSLTHSLFRSFNCDGSDAGIALRVQVCMDQGMCLQLCREHLGRHPCDKRRALSHYKKHFPAVDFSLVRISAHTFALFAVPDCVCIHKVYFCTCTYTCYV